jgi:hypothetical protein
VSEAPTFGEVSGYVTARLQGAVFVAHNAESDGRFVTAAACVSPASSHVWSTECRWNGGRPRISRRRPA